MGSRPTNYSARIVAILFFFGILGVGLAFYGDYGISFDEPQQRLIGLVNLKYILERCAPTWLTDPLRALPSFDAFPDRDHGALFELVAASAELLLLHDEPSIFKFRHLLTFLVFFVGLVAVHALARRRFSDWRLAMLACLFLVLTPRFFAESFYNSKDIVFMAMFSVALNTMIAFVLKPNPATALFHALASAIAIDVRVAAIMVPVGTVAITLLRILKRETDPPRTCGSLVVYLIATSALVPLMWPALWSEPMNAFASALQSAAHFRWDYNVLYRGQFVRSTQLPWHYVPVWISITTPVLYLGLFVAGAFAILQRLRCSGVRLWTNERELQDLIFLATFAAPIIVVVGLGSIVYDGWRHLYFIYPSFLLVAVGGFAALWAPGPRQAARQLVLAAVTLISVTTMLAWMWRVHPFQNVYFNALAGDDVRSNFELDYWGLANRTALEHILKEDRRAMISVRADSWTPLEGAFRMIKAEDRKRLKYLQPPALSDYVFNNYRGVSPPYDANITSDYYLFYEVRADDLIILSVYRRKG